MSVTLLPLGQSLVEEVARRIEAAGCPAPDCTVVFPGERPAHYLRQRLAARAGRSIQPPRIFSIQDFIDSVFTELQGDSVRPGLEDFDAVAILYDIQVSSPHPLGGTAFMTLDSFFSLGVKVYRDIEELLMEEVPGRSVAEVQVLVEEKVPARSRERLQTLAHFYEEFYKAVERRGLSTKSSRYSAVSRQIRPSHFPAGGPIILAGFTSLTRAEHRLFTTMAGWPQVSMVFQDGPGIRDRLGSFGLPPAAPAEPPRPVLHLYSSPDAHGQVFALNAALDSADESTLVVLPEPGSLFPVLRHCMSRFDEESYNVSLRYPLARTPLYGFLNDLRELVTTMDGERVYLPAYVTFVLHPYVKNIRLGSSAESSRVLFHTLEEMLAERRTQRFATLEEIEGDEHLFADAVKKLGGDSAVTAADLRTHLRGIHERTVERFRSFRSIRDFAERCMELITWVHDESTARDHPYFTPFSEEFLKSLEAITRSLMAEKSFNDAASCFILLRRYIETRDLPFKGAPLHGLQVLGALETRNLRFDRVFVLDANEGSFPRARTAETLLPVPVRAALHLPTYRDKEDVEAYYFAQLAAGARELHLFSRESGENERSRFVERLVWEEQKRRQDLDERSLVQSIQYRVDLTPAVPAAVEKSPGIMERIAELSFSATSLDAYLQCPLRFYYRFVLSLGPREESSGEIESRDIGTFVHAVLHDYFTGRTGRALAPEDADRAAMIRLVEERFATTFGSAVGGANRLLLNQLRRHLGDFVDGYLASLIAEHRIVLQGLEMDAKGSLAGFPLRGKLDVVAVKDGRPLVIDYKTSNNRSHYAIRLDRLDPEDRATWSTAMPTVQLPLYAHLHAQAAGCHPAEIQAVILLLSRSELDERIEVPLYDEKTSPADAWPRMEGVITGLMREITSPDVPFTPAPDLRAACPRCDFARICGTSWLKRA